MSPERIQGKLPREEEAYKKADMWSIGVLLYVLITGTPPFEGRTNEELYTNICKGEFLF